MIAMLAGLVDQVGDDTLVLDVNGVGYLVSASSRTLREAPARGQPLRLLIETHLREDRIQLFGFIGRGGTRLVPATQHRAGRRRPRRARDPRRARPRRGGDRDRRARQGGVRARRRRWPQVGAAHRHRIEGQGRQPRYEPGRRWRRFRRAVGRRRRRRLGAGEFWLCQKRGLYGGDRAAKRLGGEAKIDALVRAGLQELGR